MAGSELLELQRSARHGYLLFCICLLFCAGLSMGGNYVYGGLTVEQHLAGATGFLAVSPDQASWYLSVTPLTQLAGILAGCPAGERWGRKPVLVLTSLLSVLGYIIMYLSNSFWLLLLGRGINSFSTGFGSMMPFILVSEMSSIRARAPASVVGNLSFSLGGLLAFLTASFLPLSLLLPLAASLSCLFLLLCPWLPESPQHLARQGRLEEAAQVYHRLRGPDYQGVELEIKEVLAIGAGTGKGGWGARWREASFLRPLAILAPLYLAISFSGLDCPLVFYGPSMFSDFG